MSDTNFVELTTSQDLDDIKSILADKTHLQKMFSELRQRATRARRGYVVVARWYKRGTKDNGRFCPVANVNSLYYVLEGYLAGDNYDLEFYAMSRQVVKVAWSQTRQSREDLFL